MQLKFVKGGATAINLIEEDLKRVAKWCSASQRRLINPAKTKFLLVRTCQMIQSLPDGLELSFLGNQIKPVTCGKDLGVIVDSHLTYDNHKCHCVLMYE